jgi:diguanylate cyclase (GGDEF)-like protein
MRSKDSRLWLYNLALLGLTAACAWRWPPWQAGWPEPGVVLGFVAFQLLVWQYGFPVPSMGMTSMERVPQVAAILLFPPPVAAAINALPALAWPFVNRRYRQGSLLFGAIRAVHNACMIALMTALAGMLWLRLGGEVPLRALRWDMLAALLVSMAALQVVNSAMMLVFFRLDGRDVRRLATLSYLTVDTFFVPIGVLAALIVTQADGLVVALFVAFLLLTVVSLHEVVEARRKVQSRLEALDAATSARLAVSGARRIDELAERLFSQLGAMFQYHTAFVALHDAERGEFDVVIEVVDGERRPRSRKPATQGVSGHVLRTGAPLLIDNWAQVPPEVARVAVVAEGERPGSVLVVPIRQGETVLGLVSVQHRQPHRYSEPDRNALLAIAEDVAPVFADAQTFQELDEYRERLEGLVAERTGALERAAVERERLLAELGSKSLLLERQSREDPLTGIANRRHFDERLAAEIERAGRYGHPLTLALVDIDHFKRINDRGGHLLGDHVLIRIARLVAGHLRSSDFVARIGGEEFAVLFPETPLEGAATSVRLLRERLGDGGFADLAPWLRVTLSAGVAQWANGEHRDVLLRRADVCLYQAKAAGRDQVCVAEPAGAAGAAT